jgi:hypothetical protein
MEKLSLGFSMIQWLDGSMTQFLVLQIVYQAIVVFIALLVAAVTLRERSIGRQVSGGIVLIILLLRIFMVK